MVCWYENLLLYIVSLLVSAQAVDPSSEACLAFEKDYIRKKACECVVYQSYGLSEGDFKSPDYPKPYRPGLNCILYTFIGDVNEIVKIKFTDLDLKSPMYISPTQTECKDRLRIFKNLDRPEVNEIVPHQEELCGNLSSLDKSEFYSSGRAFIMEFHTDTESMESHSGFKGRFTFLEKSAFKTDGILQYGTQCSYDIQSGDIDKTGSFFSPRYPQEYPRSSNCRFNFMGRANEKVRVLFKKVSLYQKDSKLGCDDNRDIIKVYDGRDSSSKLLSAFCDTRSQVEFTSSGPYMYIEFHSDRHHENQQGFTADYEFVDKDSNISLVPGNDPVVNDDDATPAERKMAKGESLECNKSITSVTGNKSGTIESPFYPRPYSPSITCQFEFHAELNERVQLKFIQMDLYPSHADPTTTYGCLNQDRIKVYVYIESTEEELGEWCGQKHPVQLMSVGPRMKVVFISEHTQKSQNSGFRIEYHFRTDFGVLSTGVQDERKVCIFTFHSTLHTQGYFTSPNYGGKYPRNTECQYIFFGREGEIVHIRFVEFEVDGIIPRCDKQTNSDVVAFSNFLNSPDLKLLSYCGHRPSYPSVTSDAAFFRVTFKSDDKYDATGFKAVYNFEQTVMTVTPGATADPQTSNYGSRSKVDVTVTAIILICAPVINLILTCS